MNLNCWSLNTHQFNIEALAVVKMEKKVEFCLTPQVRSSARLTKSSHIIQSTPFIKDGKSPFKSKLLLPNFKIDEDSFAYNLTTNLTSNSTSQPSKRESSLYPHQNNGQIERICLEFEYLKLKMQNQKCEKKLEESNKLIDKNIKAAVELQRKKQESIVQWRLILERKQQLAELKGKSDLILAHMNEIFPKEMVKQLADQLIRYGAILIPALNTFKIINIKNGDRINGECFRIQSLDLMFFLIFC